VIRTPDQRLRVFVSSTLQELAAERAAARTAIEQLRLAPVMFESGAQAHPPQAVYRAYLEQSDIFIGIYWQRYGWVGPGMTISGLEDELQLAAGMPRLLYVKVPAPDREPGLRRMLEGIRDQGTLSYTKFTDAGELGGLVAGDLATMLSERFGEPDRHISLPVLPSPVTAMVGRDTDMQEVTQMLTAPGRRLVVLTGAGGAGKTRLALAVAERTRAQWPDGTAFVDLSLVTDPELVPDTIAAALGLVGQGRERPLDTLERGLAGRNMLLVLDNFEQVLGTAPVVADLLKSAPGLRVLVTSRVVPRLRGEQEWRVDPLRVPPPGTTMSAMAQMPAVRLFVDRVRDAQPEFELTSQNADVVAELCRRLDGLPLALELAAASMRLLTPDQLLARLPGQLERPGALADLPDRQQTLTGTIQWSYYLLPAPAQRMLARLSVFAAPFTAAGAEALGGQEDGDAMQNLSTLLDHSMVSPAGRPDGERAFRLLDPIRQFAATQLTNASQTFSHLEHYLLGVLDAASPRHGSQDRDMRRLDSEQPNLRAVLAWIARDGRPADKLIRALSDVWVWMLVRGHLRQSSTLWQQIAPLLAQEPRSGGDRMARAWLLVAGWTNQGITNPIDLVDEILPDARRVEKPWRTALLLLARGITRVESAHGQARADFVEALSVARAAGDPLAVGYVQAHYGALLCLDGELDQARALHHEALTIARSVGDENLRAEAHYVLAIDAITAGDSGTAAPELAAAVRHYHNLSHFEGLTRCLGALSGLAVERGNPHLAARLIGTAAAVRDRFGLQPWPWVPQAEQRFIERATTLLPGGEYAEQLTAGRTRPSTTHSPQPCRSWKTDSQPTPADLPSARVQSPGPVILRHEPDQRHDSRPARPPLSWHDRYADQLGSAAELADPAKSGQIMGSALRVPTVNTMTWGFGGALGGTRTPSLLIRGGEHIVQDRSSPFISWAGIPELSTCFGRRPAAWLQCGYNRVGTALILDRLSVPSARPRCIPRRRS
jgi:predicted ATPase